jgi:hypothetical protein
MSKASCSKCKEKMDRSELSARAGLLLCKKCYAGSPKVFRAKFEGNKVLWRSKMAKKVEESRLILRRMTKSQIKTLGGNMFVYSKRWTWLGAFVLGIAFAYLFLEFNEASTSNGIISITPVFVVFISFLYTLNKAGKKLWEKVKSEKEPVEIK